MDRQGHAQCLARQSQEGSGHLPRVPSRARCILGLPWAWCSLQNLVLNALEDGREGLATTALHLLSLLGGGAQTVHDGIGALQEQVKGWLLSRP